MNTLDAESLSETPSTEDATSGISQLFNDVSDEIENPIAILSIDSTRN